MRFGTHLKLFKAIEDEEYDDSLEMFSVKERLEIIIAKEKIYPLPKMPDQERVRAMAEKYNLYTNILHMSLGQFIMLESQLKSENKRDDVVAALVIRPKDEKDYDNEDALREEKILEQLLEEDVRDIYSVVGSMMLNREFILFNKFSGVLYNRYEEPEEEEEEEEGEKKQLIGEDEFKAQWFWYSIVRQLAQDDIRRFNDIYDLKMSVVMVELSFLSQKSILENARMRAEEARQRAMYRR